MGVFSMPSLGADMEAGKLVEWLVKPGDTVSRGDIVAVVETQKGAIEIEIFEDGRIHELSAKLGAELPVGAPLAVILGDGEAPPEPAPDPATEPAPIPSPEIEETTPPERMLPQAAPAAVASASGPNAASPAARVRATELGIDLAAVRGTGPGGVVVLADLEGQRPIRPPEPAKPGSPMDEMRKAIAAAMTRAKQTIPHFYLSETIDVQPAIDFLARRNADRPPTERVLLGALFVRAVCRAAAKVKVMNGHYIDGSFHPANVVNPGVAVALRGGGLVAPALMDASSLDLDQTMSGMRDLVTRARAGRLRSSEMTEGTITISSLGETGAESMTGVIFPPQVALVGVGAPQERPWIVDGAVVPRKVVTLTMSADHRVSDGRQVARFIAEFETQLKDPESL